MSRALGAGGTGAEQRREKGRREGEKRKGKKKKRKKEKEIEERKMGGRERKRREEAVRASGDCGCGRPRVACGPRKVGHAVRREKGKRGGGIRGGRSRRVALDEKDGTRIEFGCRVVRERL